MIISWEPIIKIDLLKSDQVLQKVREDNYIKLLNKKILYPLSHVVI